MEPSKGPVFGGALSLTCLAPAHLFVPTAQLAVAQPAEEVPVQVHGVQLPTRRQAAAGEPSEQVSPRPVISPTLSPPIRPSSPAHHVAAPQRVRPLLGHRDAEVHLHGSGGGEAGLRALSAAGPRRCRLVWEPRGCGPRRGRPQTRPGPRPHRPLGPAQPRPRASGRGRWGARSPEAGPASGSTRGCGLLPAPGWVDR